MSPALLYKTAPSSNVPRASPPSTPPSGERGLEYKSRQRQQNDCPPQPPHRHENWQGSEGRVAVDLAPVQLHSCRHGDHDLASFTTCICLSSPGRRPEATE